MNIHASIDWSESQAPEQMLTATWNVPASSTLHPHSAQRFSTPGTDPVEPGIFRAQLLLFTILCLSAKLPLSATEANTLGCEVQWLRHGHMFACAAGALGGGNICCRGRAGHGRDALSFYGNFHQLWSAAKMNCKMAHNICMSTLAGRKKLYPLKRKSEKGVIFLTELSLMVIFSGWVKIGKCQSIKQYLAVIKNVTRFCRLELNPGKSFNMLGQTLSNYPKLCSLNPSPLIMVVSLVIMDSSFVLSLPARQRNYAAYIFFLTLLVLFSSASYVG